MTMKKYIGTYSFEGHRYEFELYAASMQEAQRKLLALQLNGRIAGELMASIPVPTFFESVVAWFHRRS